VRRVVIFAGVACAALVAVATASATSECRGLRVCVPVAGPWVVTPSTGVEFQLSCPKRFIVGGLDAELSNRAIDVSFAGGLGSPVNPGVTTTGDAVFLGRFVGRAPAASFRPHIGCIPSSGGGQRTPTAYRVFKPGKPTLRVVKELAVRPGLNRAVATCGAGKHLIRATNAIGFYTLTPPTTALIADLQVQQVVRGARVEVVARAGARFRSLPTVAAIVQLDLLCAVGI
jgi:hypothetical protein